MTNNIQIDRLVSQETKRAGSPAFSFLSQEHVDGDIDRCYMILNSLKKIPSLSDCYVGPMLAAGEERHVYSITALPKGTTAQDGRENSQALLSYMTFAVENGKLVIYAVDPRSGHLRGIEFLNSGIKSGVRRFPITEKTNLAEALYKAAKSIYQHLDKLENKRLGVVHL